MCAVGVEQHTVATLSMSVSLPHDHKGTHMSRFLERLNSHDEAISNESFSRLLEETTCRLEASSGQIEMSFPYFILKKAPVSGAASLMDYRAAIRGSHRPGRTEIWLKVTVPVTSLCPCSKSISAYGAHNQRAHITITAKIGSSIWLDDLIGVAEKVASSELYSVLKRPDEKYVTERAYDNAKFVEDVVRDAALVLNEDPRVRAYKVESENFESIHNHSAYAMIEFDKELAP
jgi:GTP cyclohydrolase I